MDANDGLWPLLQPEDNSSAPKRLRCAVPRVAARISSSVSAGESGNAIGTGRTEEELEPDCQPFIALSNWTHFVSAALSQMLDDVDDDLGLWLRCWCMSQTPEEEADEDVDALWLCAGFTSHNLFTPAPPKLLLESDSKQPSDEPLKILELESSARSDC